MSPFFAVDGVVPAGAGDELRFANGCIANLTASRISTERVRKLRLFQPQQYLSLDYARQDLAVFSVSGERQIGDSAVVHDVDVDDRRCSEPGRSRDTRPGQGGRDGQRRLGWDGQDDGVGLPGAYA